MSKQSEMALLINGREYRQELTDLEAEQAANDGLVVIYGASDDLCYFAGFYADEKSAWEGNKYWWNGAEFISEREEKAENDPMPYKYWVTQDWCPKNADCGWVFDTNIPKSAKFIVREDDEIYGEGLVINTELMV